MKTINNYIQEKLNISTKYTCKPKTRDELRVIIEERLKKDKNADLNDIDVSSVTNMSSLFFGLDPRNIDISEWDVSNVTNMFQMFCACHNFNSDISGWDVSNATSMTWMFYGCENFDCDLSDWDVSNIEYMSEMFAGCKSLKNKPSWYNEKHK